MEEINESGYVKRTQKNHITDSKLGCPRSKEERIQH